MTENLIQIKPQSNHHGLFLMVLGVAIFLITLTLSEWLWPKWRLSLISVYLISGILFITGALKRFQPIYSLELSKESLKYNQLVGSWEVTWNDIAYISEIKYTQGVEQLNIPYIGIKLTDFGKLIEIVPVRLANKLIHEQKFLLVWALNHQKITLEESLINFNTYKSADRTEIRGPLAAFMYHSEVLEKVFGFHLFIPVSAIDRNADEFSDLLKRCWRHVKNESSY